MRAVELFAGAGGASLGITAAGFEEIRAVEWNHDACETRRAAGLRCDEGDVRDPAHYEGVGDIDLLWSSFPCQAWSTAGKRLGKDDPRNGWPWTVDVLDQVRPHWFIGENVPGLTHHRGGCNGRCVDDCARLYLEQTILRQLGERFAWVGWSVLDAARFGVAQNRERLFLVAGPRPIEWPRETHAPPEELRTVGLFGDGRKPWRTVREALSLSLSLIGQRTPETARGNNKWRSPDAPAPTIPAQADCLSARIEDPKHPHVRPESPAPALRSGVAGHSAPPMWLNQTIGSSQTSGRKGGRVPCESPIDAPAPTVTTCEVKGTRGEGQHGGPDRASDAAWLGAGIRRLTTSECAILQDYPESHPWRGTKTSIYAQIGNSVCRTVAKALCEAVRNADER